MDINKTEEKQIKRSVNNHSQIPRAAVARRPPYVSSNTRNEGTRYKETFARLYKYYTINCADPGTLKIARCPIVLELTSLGTKHTGIDALTGHACCNRGGLLCGHYIVISHDEYNLVYNTNFTTKIFIFTSIYQTKQILPLPAQRSG